MVIRHKGLTSERYDAPFIGMLISAIDCKFKCKNCCNEWLLDIPIQKTEIDEIFKTIEDNAFVNGIILGGLEWTEQPEEMRALLNMAINKNLDAMLYTGMTEEDFKLSFPDINELPIYIKYGRYYQDLKSHSQYGITLASNNQYIKNKRQN